MIQELMESLNLINNILIQDGLINKKKLMKIKENNGIKMID
jgi:hypothetical protein